MPLPRLRIDCSGFEGDLCRLGRDAGCDRSPINQHTEGQPQPFRHAYTPVFQLLFAPRRYDDITIAEIGIAWGAGLRMLAGYFPAARIVGFERREKFVEHCRALQLPRTEIRHVDFNRVDRLDSRFDIVLEDSSHNQATQVHAIRTAVPALNRGGILIIEDIALDRDDRPLEDAVQPFLPELSLASFIYPEHPNVDPSWQNEKLLVLVRA